MSDNARGANLTQLDPADLQQWKKAVEPQIAEHIRLVKEAGWAEDAGWEWLVDYHQGVWYWSHPQLEGVIAATWYWEGTPYIPVEHQTDEADPKELANVHQEATGNPQDDAKIYCHVMRPILAQALKPTEPTRVGPFILERDEPDPMVSNDCRERLARQMLEEWRQAKNAGAHEAEAKLLEILELMGVDL